MIHPYADLILNNLKDDCPYSSCAGLICFGIIILGMRFRINQFGGDVALVALNLVLGLAWGA